MPHRLLLRLGGDDLLARGGVGRGLPADLVCLGLERDLLDLLLLQLERVAHLLGLQFLGKQLLHAVAVVRREIDVADLHRLEGDAVGSELGTQFVFDAALDFLALGGEDLAHRVARERVIGHALHLRSDDLGIDIGRQAAGDTRHLAGIDAVAHRDIDAQRQSFNRLVGRGARRQPAVVVAQHLVAIEKRRTCCSSGRRNAGPSASTVLAPVHALERTPISPGAIVTTGGKRPPPTPPEPGRRRQRAAGVRVRRPRWRWRRRQRPATGPCSRLLSVVRDWGASRCPWFGWLRIVIVRGTPGGQKAGARRLCSAPGGNLPRARPTRRA